MIKARITVTLKEEVLDPQGIAIRKSLSALGLKGVTTVRQNKIFDVELEDKNKSRAEQTLQTMCEQLLANTVIENYTVAII